GPLKGINVLSFGRVLAGPYTAMLLADLGADVIKIETGKDGDMARHNGPFINDLSSYFLSVNRGKKSFSLNIRHEKGVDILKRLIRGMDILIENFRPGVMKKMGLDYEDAKELNPRLIYVSVSGFGQSGPYSSKTAFDMVAQGMGGTVSITGEPGRPPVRVGYSIGDMGAALFAVTATLAALYERTGSGIGQHIDVAMMDSQVALCENACARYMATGQIPKPIGARHPLVTPFQVFPTKTDDMVVVAFTDEQWGKMCEAVGRKDLVNDVRYHSMRARNENHAELESTLSEVFRTLPRDEWLSRFEEFDVIGGPVNNIEQVVNDPHVKARDMVLEVAHDRLGKLKVVGTPMKFSRTPCEITNASPDLGRHTEEILAEKLGMSQDEIGELREEGIINSRQPGSKGG
ncbi:MAG: CoA transferase, partial [Deltaproteobacteria bacterium]|nr:CoA transferase [Deltaproteobacteria bacterium]